MSEKKENIFRQKSIDRISSPEQLTDYIRVSTPGVWLVLVGVIILLVGICVWGVFGRIETKINTGCVISGDKLYCYVKESDIFKIKEGQDVVVRGDDSKTYQINYISATQSSFDRYGAEDQDYLLHLIGVTSSEYVYEVACDCDDPKEEVVPGVIVVESISPIKFVLN